MAKLIKEQVGLWITELMPYVKNPMYLAPKGCFKEDVKTGPGKIIQYDAALMPIAPRPIAVTETLRILVELYMNL